MTILHTTCRFPVMIRSAILTLSLIISLYGKGHGQSPNSISFYSDVLVNAADEGHRAYARSALMDEFKMMLAKPVEEQTPIDSIPWISVLKGDGFRVVTWQFRISDTVFNYDGFIQKGSDVFWLKDTRPFINGMEFNSLSPDVWYGCLYYDIVPFKNEGKDYYALLGFSADDALYNRKVAEILDMNGTAPKFGLPVFVGKEKTKNRVLLKYAKSSTVHIRFDPELNALVNDHLEILYGIGPHGEALPVADGSLEAWKLKKGVWEYEEKVYDVIMKDPPMLDENKNRKEDKDILGRPKNGER